MKLFVLSLSFSFAAFSFSFAQSNFVAGSYVDDTGEVHQGLIDFKDWDKNPKKISFKESKKTPVHILESESTQSFKVAGQSYFSAVVKLEISPEENRKLETNAEFMLRTEQVFLKVLFDGAKNLYSLKDKDGKTHLYFGELAQPKLFLYKKYIRKIESGLNSGYVNEVKILSKRDFESQLRMYLSDFKEINSRSRLLGYNEVDFYNLFTDYYEATNAPVEYKKAKAKAKFKFGLTVGLNSANYELNSRQRTRSFINDFENGSHSSLSSGLSFDILLPKNRYKVQFRNELLYQTLQFDGSHISQRFGKDEKAYVYSAEYSFLIYNLMLRYNFMFNDFRFFINGGGAVTVILDAATYLTEEQLLYSGGVKEVDFITNEYTNSHDYQFLVGIGFGYKKLSFEGRWSLGRAFAKNYFDTSLNVNTVSLFISRSL